MTVKVGVEAKRILDRDTEGIGDPKDTIIDREIQQEKLHENVFSPLMKGNKPFNVMITGLSGLGKTYTSKTYMSNYLDSDLHTVLLNKKLGVGKFLKIYINIGKFGSRRVKRLYVLQEIFNHLIKLGFMEKRKTIGLSDNQLWERIINCIKRNNLFILLCLDEIDRVVNAEGNCDFIHNLLELSRDSSMKNCGIGIIFISNVRNLKMDGRTRDRIDEFIDFNTYSKKDLEKILKYYTNLPNVLKGIDDEDISNIADFCSENFGSARAGKKLLFRVAKKFEEGIITKDKKQLKALLFRLYDEISENRDLQLLRDSPINWHWVLFSKWLYKENVNLVENILDKISSDTSSLGRTAKKYFKVSKEDKNKLLPSIKNIYKYSFKPLMKSLDKDEITYKTFTQYVNSMKEAGIIDTETKTGKGFHFKIPHFQLDIDLIDSLLKIDTINEFVSEENLNNYISMVDLKFQNQKLNSKFSIKRKQLHSLN